MKKRNGQETTLKFDKKTLIQFGIVAVLSLAVSVSFLAKGKRQLPTGDTLTMDDRDAMHMQKMRPKGSALAEMSEESDLRAGLPPLQSPFMGLDLIPLNAEELEDAKGKLGHKFFMSQRHPVDPRVDTLPAGSESYAFAYPCGALKSGGFVYFKKVNGDDKIIAIHKVNGAGTTLFFDQVMIGGKDEFEPSDFPSACEEGSAKITIFNNAQTYCYQPECKLVGDETLGCFVYLMNNRKIRAYLTRKHRKPTGKALLIIDVQKCFLPGGSLAVEADHIVPVINKLREKDCLFDTVIKSQDYHQEGHISFGKTNGVPNMPPGSVIPMRCLKPATGKMSEAACCPDPNKAEFESINENLARAYNKMLKEGLNTACTACWPDDGDLDKIPDQCFAMDQAMWPVHCL